MQGNRDVAQRRRNLPTLFRNFPNPDAIGSMPVEQPASRPRDNRPDNRQKAERQPKAFNSAFADQLAKWKK